MTLEQAQKNVFDAHQSLSQARECWGCYFREEQQALEQRYLDTLDMLWGVQERERMLEPPTKSDAVRDAVEHMHRVTAFITQQITRL